MRRMRNTFGWVSRIARPASRRSRSTEVLSAPSLGLSTLIATLPGDQISFASYTYDIPPSPSLRNTSYLLSRVWFERLPALSGGAAARAAGFRTRVPELAGVAAGATPPPSTKGLPSLGQNRASPS